MDIEVSVHIPVVCNTLKEKMENKSRKSLTFHPQVHTIVT